MAEKSPFEEAMQRLEEIVDLMGRPTTSLDVSLSLYEEADRLMQICEKRLCEVEHRVKALSDKREGTVEEVSL